MAPKAPSKTTQVTEVKLPAWVDKASEENYKLATELGKAPFEQYTGQRVADLSDPLKKAIDMSMKGAGSSDKYFKDAGGIFSSINKDATALGNKSFLDYDINKYMNPFVDNVETKALDALDRSRLQSLNSNSSAATAAKAFGGSRHGIVDAVTNSESAREAGLLSANLRKDAFDNATGLINADRTNALAALQQRATAGSGLLQTGTSSNEARLKDIASLLQGGGIMQQNQQQKLDAAREKFDEKRNYDIDNLNLRLSALGMSPYGKTESTQKTQTGGSSGTDFGQLGLGLFSLLLGVSEDTMKTDKEKVGKVPGTDLDLWAWRYKKDPKTYPKVVGVMASDVEKKMPDAVVKVDGKRLINYGMIGEAMANG